MARWCYSRTKGGEPGKGGRERLAGNGIFLCEEHLESDEDVIGPKNPSYRLARNELRRSVTAVAKRDDEVLYHHEGRVTDPDGRDAALAQLVLRRQLNRS